MSGNTVGRPTYNSVQPNSLFNKAHFC